MDVRVRGASLRLPQLCACCLAPSTHEVAASLTKRLHLGIASHERTLRVEVPYCLPCARHVEWAEAGGRPRVYLRAILVFFATVAAGMVGAVLALEVGPALLVEIAPRYGSLGGPPMIAWAVVAPFASCVMPIVVATLFARRALRAEPTAPTGPEHAGAGHAIRILDFDDDGVTLSARNEAYGARLLAANR